MHELLEPGVYLDLSLAHYLADPGLSASAFKALLVDPPAWRWEQPDNPLWERVETRFQLRGTACHAAILEGIDAYEARFAVPPKREDHPDMLETCDEMRAWLRNRDLKVGGGKAELVERINLHNIEGERLFWEDFVSVVMDGRAPIRDVDDAYVRLMHAFVARVPEFSRLVSRGLPEVSVIWTDEQGHRLKARLDYLNKRSVTDLKTYGASPRRGQSLRQHVISQVVSNGYDIQAVHNRRAAHITLNMARGKMPGAIVASGESASERIELLQAIAEACEKTAPEFNWLFLRMGSAPCGISLPLRDGKRWRHVEDEIAQALDNYDEYSRAFAPGELWFGAEGSDEIDDDDWPLWSWDFAR